MEGDVSTAMDKLVGLLEQRDKIKVSDAAKELGTDKEHIEDWAKMLERAGIVEIHYSVVGGASLKRGSKFDEILKQRGGGGKPQPQGKEGEEKTKEHGGRTPRGEKGKYLLIRSGKDSGIGGLEDELEMLEEEEKRIVEYTNMLETEEKRLGQYIQDLRSLLKEVKRRRGEVIKAEKNGE